MLKNIFSVFSIVCILFNANFCLSFKKIQSNNFKNRVYIRIKNNSNYTLNKIAIFSIPFRNLNPGEKSEFKILNFNKTTDDPMLFLTATNVRFGIYVSPHLHNGKYTYLIDSLNLNNKYMYLTEVKD